MYVGTPVVAATATVSSTTSTTVDITTPIPAGAAISVVAGTSGGVASSAISDTQGNTYTESVSVTVEENVQYWTCFNATALNAVDSVTITWSTSTSVQKNVIIFYTLYASGTDVAEGNDGSSTTASVGATPASGGGTEMCVFVVQNANAGGSPTSPSMTGTIQLVELEQVNASGEQYTTVYYADAPFVRDITCSATITSAAWAAIMVTLKPAYVLAPAAPSLPVFDAGYAPQQSDFQSWWVNTAGFFQNRMVFRGRQASTTNTIGTAMGTIGIDTVDEDPWSGWDSSTHAWTPPDGYSGWFSVTAQVSTDGASSNGVLLGVSIPPNAETQYMPVGENAPDIVAGYWVVYMTGGQDSIALVAFANNNDPAGTTSTAVGYQSSLEVVWLSS